MYWESFFREIVAQPIFFATFLLNFFTFFKILLSHFNFQMNHFREERDAHLKKSIKDFIQEQIKFYQEVIARLQTAEQLFD